MTRLSTRITGALGGYCHIATRRLIGLAHRHVGPRSALTVIAVFGGGLARSTVADVHRGAGAPVDSREVTEHATTTPGVALSVACPAGDDRACVSAGDSFTVPIRASAGATPVVGGQFHLAYDPACLHLDAVDPGSACDIASPFELEVFEQTNPVAGRVFYAAGIGFGGLATSDAATLACATFTRLADCGTCNLCLITVSGAPSYLTGLGGQLVPAELVGDGCGCHVAGTSDIHMEVPASSSYDSACHTPTAQATWAPPTATDSCEGPLDVVCTCSHSDPLVPPAACQGWIAGGGEIPQGTADFCCSASNSCGQSASACWTITVSDSMTFRALVQLSPTTASEPFNRCVEFVLHRSCVETPIISRGVLTFGAAGQSVGQAEFDFSVPSAAYGCISARDPLHTLRARGRLECVEGGAVEALFTDEPAGEGSWLIAGNLDADHDVDILDFGAMMDQYLSLVPPDSDCAQTAGGGFVHADLNGDGIVDGLDFAFVEGYLGMSDVATCCPNDGGAGFTPAPTMAISTDNLAPDDPRNVARGDLNLDGVLDERDMAAFRAGHMPTR